MPVPVAPMKTTCQSCGWSRVTPQQGDVLFITKQCERCGSERLTLAKAGVLDRLNPASIIKRALMK